MKTQIDEVQYGAMLEKEALVMRAQKQRKNVRILVLLYCNLSFILTVLW